MWPSYRGSAFIGCLTNLDETTTFINQVPDFHKLFWLLTIYITVVTISDAAASAVAVLSCLQCVCLLFYKFPLFTDTGLYSTYSI